ncbi:MAG TPA: PH domain-containing protein [Anaerolineae bacterium]|nr:PH domain-containing protein [Anaerolineae bacterium]
MIFKPAPSTDGRRALLAGLVLIVLDLIAAILMAARPVGGSTFTLLLLVLALWLPLGYVLWRAWLCLSLAYWIDRNAITLAWGPMRQVIPISAVQQVQRTQAVTAMLANAPVAPGPNGQVDQPALAIAARWPGLARFVLYGPDLGTRRRLHGAKVYSVASQPLADQLLLHTDIRVYGISPADAEGFLAALQQQHQLGPTHLAAHQRQWPRWMRFPLWQDRFLLILLLAGFLGALLLLGIAMSRFTSLPFALPQWDNLDRRMIFLFPIFGLSVWLINGVWGLLVYERQRVAAGLLWGGALAAQAAALVALLSVTRV